MAVQDLQHISLKRERRRSSSFARASGLCCDRFTVQRGSLHSTEEPLMPSPFPGMDPYLEHPDFFPGLHDDLISQMKEALQQSLPEGYYATSKARVWIEVSQRYLEPDVGIQRPGGAGQPTHRP